MRTEVLRSVAGLWFRYLKSAQKMGKAVDWSFYREWGSPDEIAGRTFNAWWTQRGRELFDRKQRKLTAVKRGDNVIVTIPITFTARELRRELGPVVKPFLSKEVRAQRRGKYLPTGLVNYKVLAKYLRLLELEIGAKGQPMREKLLRLEQFYAKNQERVAGQNDAIRRKAGDRKRFRKFRAGEVKGATVRDGYLWLKKARKIADNVASGTFPGRAYYQTGK
jgi:hypothetical protein